MHKKPAIYSIYIAVHNEVFGILPFMIRVIFNRKGGVGKSSITCNLAAVSAHSGKKTLVVDLDPQANSTRYLGHDSNDDTVGIPEFFKSQISFKYSDFTPLNFVRKTDFDNLHLISASHDLIDIEQQLESRHKIYKLRDFLGKLLNDFEMIFIDTPPALNFYTLSALIAADSCLIPYDCDAFSREALEELVRALEEIREDHNDKLVIEGIVINQFVSRARLPKTAVEELQANGYPVLTPYISSSVKMKESHAACRPLINFEPRHKLTTEFTELFNRLGTTAA